MASLFRSLLLVIAGATQKELARQIRYLKLENQILRSKLPARVTITPAERQRSWPGRMAGVIAAFW